MCDVYVWGTSLQEHSSARPPAKSIGCLNHRLPPLHERRVGLKTTGLKKRGEPIASTGSCTKQRFPCVTPSPISSPSLAFDVCSLVLIIAVMCVCVRVNRAAGKKIKNNNRAAARVHVCVVCPTV